VIVISRNRGRRRAMLGRAIAGGSALATLFALGSCAHLGVGFGDHQSRVSTHFTSFGGPIRVAQAPRGAALRAFGGDIEVGEAAGRVRITSYGGNVRVGPASDDVRITSYGGSIVASIVEDGSVSRQRIKLKSYGGNVTLRVPESISARIDVRVSYGRDAEDDPHLESDFDLEREESPSFQRSWPHLFKPVKTLTARGVLGDGAGRIDIRVEGGNVRLERAGASS